VKFPPVAAVEEIVATRKALNPAQVFLTQTGSNKQTRARAGLVYPTRKWPRKWSRRRLAQEGEEGRGS